MRILYSLTLSAILLGNSIASATDQVAPPVTTPPGATESASAQQGGWLDKMSASFKEWTNKVPEMTEEAKKYSEDIKAKWPGIKEDFAKHWQSGVDKSKEAGASVQEWFNQTFSEERVTEAENWLKKFKAGTEEKVIDPLVPYLLSLRYPEPIDEWNQGYRRLFPVQISKDSKPVEVTLPLSWDLSTTIDTPKDRIITWRSDSGQGKYDVSIIVVSQGSTVDSLVAGLQRQNPEATVAKLEGTQIVRIQFLANASRPNAANYYAIPLKDSVVLLCGEVLANGDAPAVVNNSLQKQTNFFDTVAKAVFIKE